MRGSDKRSRELFSYVDLEQRVRQDHPLRAIRSLTDAALEAPSADFAALYSDLGRPSIPPDLRPVAARRVVRLAPLTERTLDPRERVGVAGLLFGWRGRPR